MKKSVLCLIQTLKLAGGNPCSSSRKNSPKRRVKGVWLSQTKFDIFSLFLGQLYCPFLPCFFCCSFALLLGFVFEAVFLSFFASFLGPLFFTFLSCFSARRKTAPNPFINCAEPLFKLRQIIPYAFVEK